MPANPEIRREKPMLALDRLPRAKKSVQALLRTRLLQDKGVTGRDTFGVPVLSKPSLVLCFQRVFTSYSHKLVCQFTRL